MGTEKKDYVDGRIQNFNDLEIVKRLRWSCKKFLFRHSGESRNPEAIEMTG